MFIDSIETIENISLLNYVFTKILTIFAEMELQVFLNTLNDSGTSNPVGYA